MHEILFIMISFDTKTRAWLDFAEEDPRQRPTVNLTEILLAGKLVFIEVYWTQIKYKPAEIHTLNNLIIDGNKSVFYS